MKHFLTYLEAISLKVAPKMHVVRTSIRNAYRLINNSLIEMQYALAALSTFSFRGVL